MCYFKYFNLLFCYLYISPTNQGNNQFPGVNSKITIEMPFLVEILPTATKHFYDYK